MKQENKCYVVEFRDGSFLLFNNKDATLETNQNLTKRIIAIKDETKLIDVLEILYFTQRAENNTHLKNQFEVMSK